MVFFREEALPVGSVPLTAERSIAVDRRSIPYGTPVWMKSTEPQTSFARLVLASWRAASSSPCNCGPCGHAEPDAQNLMTLTCRPGCAACCTAPSISSPIPGMLQGKPAGVPCIQLDAQLRCMIFGQAERPAVCGQQHPQMVSFRSASTAR